MTVAFSDHEKNKIREALLGAAQDCMRKYGIRKTTVDELARIAGISKGAFYLFYPTKEALFFDAFEAYQQKVAQELVSRIPADSRMNRAQFADVLLGLYIDVKNSFIPNILEQHEYEYLLRKLPPEYFEHHKSVDDLFTENLFAALCANSRYDVPLISAAFRAVFLTLLHQKEIGEDQFDAVLKLLITALANEIIEEDAT